MRLLFHLLFVPLFIFACALAAIWLPHIAAAPFEAWLDDLMTLAGAAESSAQPDNG
jgi:hypothetical protein